MRVHLIGEIPVVDEAEVRVNAELHLDVDHVIPRQDVSAVQETRAAVHRPALHGHVETVALHYRSSVYVADGTHLCEQVAFGFVV